VLLGDGTGTLTLVYFNVKGDHLQRLLPPAAERVVSGRVEYYGGLPQMPHPDHVVPPEEVARCRRSGRCPRDRRLSSRIIARGVAAAGTRPELPDWLDPALRERRLNPAGARRSARSPPKRCRPPRRASGSPMTKSLPASSRWRWCAPAVIGKRGGRSSRPAR
jgi:ATP-dependent DNA helicase RecG